MGHMTDKIPRRPGSGQRAMVVEDETELAALVGSYLERAGFEVTLCHDGAQAVTRAREVDPDVIVLDLGLPGLDGVEVCREVRTFSDAYVVMLTARSEEVDPCVRESRPGLTDERAVSPASHRERKQTHRGRCARHRACRRAS